MSHDSKNPSDGWNDLIHFLKLASSQLGGRIQKESGKGPYSETLNRMRMLNELLNEQVPHEDTRPPARAAR